jgi:hypothetical protein
MSQITLAFRRAPQSERLFRWQSAVISALSGGSLTAALLNLGALMTVSVARSVLSHAATARRWAEQHA